MDKPQEPFWKRELKEVFAISFTFFILFILFGSLKKAILGQHQIEYYALGTALVGSLILGKVVLIFDKLPLTKKMDHTPNIYRVFFRSFIYLLGYAIFTMIEHWVKGMIDGESLRESIAHAFKHLSGLEFAMSMIVVFIAFLFFNAFWVIRTKYGPKALYQLFFSKVK
jgi:hypothetical protein